MQVPAGRYQRARIPGIIQAKIEKTNNGYSNENQRYEPLPEKKRWHDRPNPLADGTASALPDTYPGNCHRNLSSTMISLMNAPKSKNPLLRSRLKILVALVLAVALTAWTLLQLM